MVDSPDTHQRILWKLDPVYTSGSISAGVAGSLECGKHPGAGQPKFQTALEDT
jgi:hypothetical protein